MNPLDRKITAGLFSGSIMAILAWISKQFFGTEIPADVALAGATVITGVIQYVIPNKESVNEVSDPPAA